MIAAKDRVKYIVFIHFNFMTCVVPHKNSIGIRWRLIFLIYVLVVLPASLVRR
jgi:hypothetical protein